MIERTKVVPEQIILEVNDLQKYYPIQRGCFPFHRWLCTGCGRGEL